jgi:hypothetical protein
MGFWVLILLTTVGLKRLLPGEHRIVKGNSQLSSARMRPRTTLRRPQLARYTLVAA